MSRTIHRYRYAGSRPPAGTTGPDTQPTGPILARVNRYVRRPRRLLLVLAGTPTRDVTVVETVTCFSRNTQASGGGPTLQLAVPSRTRITLPGARFTGCVVDALVIGSHPGAVTATVARG